jgi:hypothetical protein
MIRPIFNFLAAVVLALALYQATQVFKGRSIIWTCDQMIQPHLERAI